MALGLIFWVSWISLLIDSNVGSPNTKDYWYSYGYQYPYKTDPLNLVDNGDDGEDGDGDNEVLTSLVSENNQQAANNQQAGSVYRSYNKPSAEQQDLVPNQQTLSNAPSAPKAEGFADWQDLVSTQQNQLNAQSTPKVKGLVDGKSRQWELVNLNEPLTFPLRPSYDIADPGQPKPAAVKLQSRSLNVYTGTMPLSTSTGETTRTSQTAYYEPASSSTFQAVTSPSYGSWQPEPMGNGNEVADSGFDYPGWNSNTDSSGYSYHSRKEPSLVSEEVFQYPYKNPEPSQSSGPAANVVEGYGQANYMGGGSATKYASTPVRRPFTNDRKAGPLHQSWRGAPPSSKFSGGRNLNFNQMFYQPQNPVFSTPRVKVSQSAKVPSRGYQPILSHPHPSSYIARSRSSYQSGRYIQSKTRYTPEYPVNGLMGVKGPAQNYPAEPSV